jgi:hypothetical protein
MRHQSHGLPPELALKTNDLSAFLPLALLSPPRLRR